MSLLRISPWWALLPTMAGLWLLWLAPVRLVGLDTEIAGCVLLSMSVWVAIGLMLINPRQTCPVMSPSETQTWIALAFSALLIIYLLSATDLLMAGEWLQSREVQHVGTRAAIFVVAWIAVGAFMQVRARGVAEDERDRALRATSTRFSNGAVAMCLMGYVAMLGLSPAERLRWVTPPAIATQLLFVMLWGCVVEYAAQGIMYWRDRR